MTKYEVLAAFAESGDFLKPDDLRARLKPRPDRRSVYSYLLRFASTGLLKRPPKCRRGSLAYRLTERGYARLKYFTFRYNRGRLLPPVAFRLRDSNKIQLTFSASAQSGSLRAPIAGQGS